jgi:hypothetical protein
MDYLAYTRHIQCLVRENTLAHHGVKGQSWGDRKYQYEDGSLTPEGKIHYGVGDGSKKSPQPTKPPAKKKTSSSNRPKAKTKADLEKELDDVRQQQLKSERNKKLLVAGVITAAAIILIVGAKKLSKKDSEIAGYKAISDKNASIAEKRRETNKWKQEHGIFTSKKGGMTLNIIGNNNHAIQAGGNITAGLLPKIGGRKISR